MATWLYDIATKTFISENGRRLSEGDLNEVRDQYLDSMSELVAAYSSNLDGGSWTMPQYEEAMRKRLKDAHIAEYVLGRGGISQMTPSDYGRIGATLKKEYGYLRSFLDDIAAGKETAGQANNRARNFLGGARQSFSRGRGKAYGLDLPAHPGSGTICHGNCRCHWDIVEDETEWRCYWILSSENPCVDCVTRAAEYNPWIQVKDSA